MLNYMEPVHAITQSKDPGIRGKLWNGTWISLVSGLLTVVLVGVIGLFLVVGYNLRLLKNVQNGEEHPLPDWDRFGADVGLGFRLWIVQIVWSLPALVFALIAVLTVGYDVGQLGIPQMGFSVWTVLQILYTILVALAGPAISIAVAQHGRISDGLRAGPILNWTFSHLGYIVLALIVSIVVGIVLGIAGAVTGALALGIGLLFTIPFASFCIMVYYSHLYGQLARHTDVSALADEAVY